MRELRKRLTCVNRGNSDANKKAMLPIIARYCNKMAMSGWKASTEWQSNGNDFFVWEHYISLYKLSDKDIRENNKNVEFYNNIKAMHWNNN